MPPSGLELIERAAAQLRHRAIADAYASQQHMEVAFGLAAAFDELARLIRALTRELELHGRMPTRRR